MAIYDDYVKKYIYGMPGQVDTGDAPTPGTRGLIGKGGQYGGGVLQGLLGSPAITQGIGLLSMGMRGIDPATALQKTNQVRFQQEALKDRQRKREFIDKYASEVPEADRELFKAYPELYIKSRGLGGTPKIQNMYDPKTKKITSYNLNNPSDLQKFREAKSSGHYAITQPGIQATSMEGLGLGKAATGDVEKKLIASGQLSTQLERMDVLFEDQYLSYQGKIKRQIAEKADKAGIATPEQKQYLQQYESWRQSQNQFFNQYRKEITGVAAGEKELRWIQESIPSTEDSPAAYRAKLKLQKQIQQDIQRNAQAFKSTGKSPFNPDGTITPEFKKYIKEQKLTPSADNLRATFNAYIAEGRSLEQVKKLMDLDFKGVEWEKIMGVTK